MSKVCTACRKEKSLEEFYKGAGRQGRRSQCIACIRKWPNGIRPEPAGKSVIQKRYYQRHKSEIAAYQKDYRDRQDKNLLNERRKDKYHTRPEYKAYVLAYVHKRRTLVKNAEGSFTVEEWLDLVEKFGGICADYTCEATDLTVDHVIPISAGGTNYISNIQPLCRSHNAKKFTHIADYRV